LTIGVGRNLEATGISREEAIYLLQNDIARVYGELFQALHPWFNHLAPIRQDVLINMAFNMGTEGLLKFTKTLALLEEDKYDEAADEMLHSTWATQVGDRATELSQIMRTGVR
jgi:lysozyme